MLSEAMAAVGLGHLPQDPHSPHFLIPSSATVIGAAVIYVGRKVFRLVWLLVLMYQEI